jgi:hypothetical protein
MSRRVGFRVALAGAACLFGSHAIAGGDEPVPEQARLKAHVVTLASPEFAGRRGAGGVKAAEYVVEGFKTLGLEPFFPGRYEQTIPGKDGGPALGRNVGDILRGSDPALRDEFVILAAHFDHLGTRGDVVYPGADDNATGVGMMLEVARVLRDSAQRPRRSVMFIGFDLEEAGLFGSRYFAEHSPVPLSQVALFVTADMLGRSLGGVCRDDVFVMGAEHAPAVRPWVERAARNRGVTVGQLGSDVLLLDRSDYGPFRSRKIPYLFFSTGENPVYHTPRDVPETIDFAKFEANSRVIASVVRQALDAPERPKWCAAPKPTLAEAVTIRAVMRALMEHREQLKIGAAPQFLMTNALKSLDAMIARGAITPEERSGVVRVARVVLLSVF